jgi:alpha-beta hydrolase superfamily lysophospholipase
MTPRMSPELLYAESADGWHLAIHHWAARGPRRNHPVLMVHGMGANRLNLDLDDRHSVARAVRQRGFEVYLLELRGVGLSRAPERPRPAWGFEDYATADLPTAVDFVLRHAGAERLHGFGHSMGGMLFYRYGTTRPAELASITAVASPLVCQLELAPYERRLLDLAVKLAPRDVSARVPLRLLLGAGVAVPFASKLADGVLLNAANTDNNVLLRMAKEAIDDIPLQLVLELTQQMARGDASPYAYEAALDRIEVPVLAIGGSADRIAPPSSVKAAVARLHAPDVRYREMGVRHGDRCDYGHIDLLVGKNAPEEVFPLLVDFLEEVDGAVNVSRERLVSAV